MSNVLNRLHPMVSKGAKGYSTTNNRTHDDIPPESPDQKPDLGSYCIRATTPIISTNPKDHLIYFEGYDDSLNIMQEVDVACERNRGGNQTCGSSKVVFFGPMKECSGVIYKNSSDPTVGKTVVSYGRLL